MQAIHGDGYHDQELTRLRALICDAATMAPAKDMLKRRELPSSASSWNELWDKRILPAREKAQLADLDLANLLRESEETGNQHVFLYRCNPRTTQRLLAENRVRNELATRGLAPLSALPRVVDQPERPSLVDVRFEYGSPPQALVVKAIETRERRQRVGERIQNGRTIEIYEAEMERAVNLFRLHKSGKLELRIQSHSAKDYREDQLSMWELAGDLLPFDEFDTLPLVHARHQLWAKRGKLVGKLRYRHLEMHNTMGTTLQVSSHQPDDDIAVDRGAVKTIETFLKNKGFFDVVDVYCLKSKLRELPSRDVHVKLGGEVNELSISGRCAKEDHKYVLDLVDAHS